MNPQEDNIQLPAVDPSAVNQPSQDPVAPTHSVSPQANSTAPQNMPQVMPSSSTGQAASPAVAGDVDLIEKEWVEKAKSIVNSTTGDPHAQSQKINEMKADYIQKRYNKTIRSEE